MAASAQPSKRSTAKTQATPESQTQFLYLILKQLDLKTVNWQDVADGIGIKNGHAARMRWSRFKAQTEGLPTQSTKKKRSSDKDDGKASSCKKYAGTGGGMEEAMMDEREFKRVKTERNYPGPSHMHYPPPPGPWGPYPPLDAGMHPMVKHEGGMTNVKMEPGDMHSHPPFGPWLGPLPGAPPVGPPPPMHDSMTPSQIFAMHGYASNIDPDDLPIKQGQLGVPGTVSMADLHLPRPEEPSTHMDIHNAIDPAITCSNTDDRSNDSSTSNDNHQDQSANANNNPSTPPLHSIPLHQPGPDSPSSSTDDPPTEPPQHPIPQHQTPLPYDPNNQPPNPFAYTTPPHTQHPFSIPFPYPYAQPPPYPTQQPARLPQQHPQPTYPYMPPPYPGYPGYRPMGPTPPLPAGYPPYQQPGMPMSMSMPVPMPTGAGGGGGGGGGSHAGFEAMQQQQQHQQQQAMPFGPIPEYVPLGGSESHITHGAGTAAAGATIAAATAAAVPGAAEAQKTLAVSAGKKASLESGNGNVKEKEKGGERGHGEEVVRKGLEPQFVVPCTGGEREGGEKGDAEE